LEFLKAARRPHAIVATKCDRLSGNQLPMALRTLGQEYAGATIIPFSAKTGTGKDELWGLIRDSVSHAPAI